MLLTVPGRLNLVVAGLVITSILYFTTFRAPSPQEQDLADLSSSHHHLSTKTPPSTGRIKGDVYRVQNETLGFHEIYMISLPGRSDKQDAFAEQAAYTDLSYTQLDGVYGHDVPFKALPHTMGQEANVIGCWRAHMNVYQKMVHEKVSSALIFEDDADWDVALKHQLVQFALGSRFILNGTGNAIPHSPYGDNWDILWLGHCGTWVHAEHNRRFFVIPDDPTVEPPDVQRKNVDMPKMTPWELDSNGNTNRTRIVFHSEGGVCTAAYAISQAGARKALYHMSMVPFNSLLDWGLAGLCKNKAYNFTCVSPWPQLIGVSRPTANTAKWSDIGYGPDSEKQVEQGHSLHLVYSLRQNIANMLQGTTIFDSQYPDTAPPSSIEDIGRAVGHMEILDPSRVPVLNKSKDGSE